MKKPRQRQLYNIDNISLGTVSDELSLLNLGDTEGLKIKIPYYCVNYLIYLYGKNWKIPVKNYNWEKNKNFASNK